jgi:flagellar assembly factor FliW
MTASAAVALGKGWMTVRSDLLGPIEVRDDQVLRFDDGLAGFTACTKWILIDGARAGTAWLQSADVSSLAFLLIDPFLYFDDFFLDLSPQDLRRVGADDAARVAVFAVVTLPATRAEPATANLQGPIVINVAGRRAVQIVLDDSPWGVRQPFQLFSPIAGH